MSRQAININPHHTTVVITILAVAIMLLSGCYHGEKTGNAAINMTQEQADSARFVTTHHYSVNYNFIVKADSINLVKQQPEEVISRLPTDTVQIYHHDHIVVAEIRVIPTDPVDSVWIQVARDQNTFGWIHESSLLSSVVPSDPISQFISAFSDIHLLIFLIIISAISSAYLARTILRRNAKIVHFNDINSFYPTLLALIVASSATLYSSIQTFAPDMWRNFYFHPTLNPFNVPLTLGIFIASVWAMLIVGLAAIDVVRNMLPTGEALLYLCGLAGVCAVNYIVFSITTLYYIGYILYIAYLYFALKRYFDKFRETYVCGNCGAPMKSKGRCPVCGRENF